MIDEHPKSPKEMSNEELYEVLREQINFSRNRPEQYDGHKARAVSSELYKRGCLDKPS